MNTIIMNDAEYVSREGVPSFRCSSSPIQIRKESSSQALHRSSRSNSSTSSEIDQFLSAEPTPKMPFILANNHQRLRKPSPKVQVYQNIPLEGAKIDVFLAAEEPRSKISLYMQDERPQEKLFRLRQLARKRQKIESLQMERNTNTCTSRRKSMVPAEIYSFVPITSW